MCTIGIGYLWINNATDFGLKRVTDLILKRSGPDWRRPVPSAVIGFSVFAAVSRS